MENFADNEIMEQLQSEALSKGVKLTYTQKLFYVRLLRYGLEYGNVCPEGISVSLSVDELTSQLSISKRMVIQSLRVLCDCGILLRYKGEKSFPRVSNTTVLKREFYERSN